MDYTPFIFIIFSFFLVVVCVRYSHKKQAQRLKEFARQTLSDFDWLLYGEKRSWFAIFRPCYIEISHSGNKLLIWDVPSGKNQPAASYFYVSFPCKFSLAITREHVLTEVGKKLGLCREIKVHQPELDKHFFFSTNEERQALSFATHSFISDFLSAQMGNHSFGDITIAESARGIDYDSSPSFISVKNGLRFSLFGTVDKLNTHDSEIEKLVRNIFQLVEIARQVH